MTEHVDLSLPAHSDLLFLTRFHVGAVASKINFGLEDVDDLQLAVEELCLSLLGPNGGGVGMAGSEGRLSIVIAWDDLSVTVTCTLTRSPADGATPDGSPASGVVRGVLPSELSARILDALVDDHGTSSEDGRLEAWLRKQRVPALP
jgi:hypothetical protein